MCLARLNYTCKLSSPDGVAEEDKLLELFTTYLQWLMLGLLAPFRVLKIFYITSTCHLLPNTFY